MDKEKLKVAIQGVHGAFHEIAARAYFKDEDVELIPCNTFKQIFEVMQCDSSILGIMAIENTIAGSLLQNHTLLSNSDLSIIGEYKLRIEHNLVALRGQRIADMKEVHSHPIALMQCEDFLENHKFLKLVESEDTALSAKEISEQGITGQAAICSRFAAEIYDLEILAEGIETNKHNFTRFLVLANGDIAQRRLEHTVKDKASLMFTVPHEEGSLSSILTMFSFYHMNLSKIQSLPIIGREWEYRFYVNLCFDDYTRYRQSLTAIMPLVKDFKVLGEYASAK